MDEPTRGPGMWPCPDPECTIPPFVMQRRLFTHIQHHHPGLLPAEPGTLDSLEVRASSTQPENEPGHEQSESTTDPSRHRNSRSAPSSAQGDLHYTPYPGAGTPTDKPRAIPYYLRPNWNPWAPFCCGTEFNLAKWFIQSEASAQMINDYFNSGLAAPYPDYSNPGLYLKPTFRTAQQLWRLITQLREIPPRFQTCMVYNIVDKSDRVPFHYRDIVATIKYIIRQPCFETRFISAPAIAKLDNGEGERVYADLHTGDWWHQAQNDLPDRRGTIIPLIFASDGVMLTQHSGSKEAWPIYMAIGNVPMEDRMKLAGGARILVGFLPLPPPAKHTQIHDTFEQMERNRQVIASCLARILEPIRKLAADTGFLARCPGGLERNFFPRLACWIADNKEAVNLHAVLSSRCVKCETKTADFENYVKPEDLHEKARSQARYDIEFEELAGLILEHSPLKMDEDASKSILYDTTPGQDAETEPHLQPGLDAALRERTNVLTDTTTQDQDPVAHVERQSTPEDVTGNIPAGTENEYWEDEEDSWNENEEEPTEDSNPEPEDDADEDYAGEYHMYGSWSATQRPKKRKRIPRPPPAHASQPIWTGVSMPNVGEVSGTDQALLLTKMADYRPGPPTRKESPARKKQRKLRNEYGLQLGRNNFANLPGTEPSQVHHADSLHVLILGIFHGYHLMDWMQRFLIKHNRLKQFHEIWCTMTPYKGFRRPTKPFCDVEQWSGSEIKSFVKILVPCLEAALWNAQTPHEKREFKAALRCVASIVDFYLMTQYRSHTQETLDWLDRYLQRFHLAKQIFREFRAGSNVKSSAKRSVGQMLTTEKREGKRPRTKEQIEKLELKLQLERATFSFPKLHLANHFRETGFQIGSLLQTSTEFGEAPHTRIKAAYQNTNKIKPELQMVNRLDFEHAFALRIENLRHAAAMLGQDRCPYELQDSLELYTTRAKKAATLCRQAGGNPVLSIPRPPLHFANEKIQRTKLIGSQTRSDKVRTMTQLDAMYGKTLGYTAPTQDENHIMASSRLITRGRKRH